QDWVDQTVAGLSALMKKVDGDPEAIEGISFSGQMHGLVLLDENDDVLRPASLWNDRRTTQECEDTYEVVGKERLLEITKNPALERFTLQKILWVKKNEHELFSKVDKFVLPKDYLRYKLTRKLQMEYSDAAGTLLLDVSNKKWSAELCDKFGIDVNTHPQWID